MENFKVFIVEDDDFYGELLKFNLALNPDYIVERYINGKELLDNLHKKPDVISLDFKLPDISGIELIDKIRKFDPEVPIIIVSGQEDVGTAVELLKKGVFDYIVKDADTKDRIWNAVKHVRENTNLKQEISNLKEQIGKKFEFSNSIKGNSKAIKKAFELMEKATRTNITVSISGETGTGKELVAKAIHYNSPRSKMPFIAVNVSAIPHDLIESEFFGHEKGAFTNAITRRIGKFEEANKGTIFLDEVAEMDMNMQTKLLRVLQEKEVTRIGSNTPVKIDVRVIVATHRNLIEEVKAGRFREDLYYRLLGLPVELPPLRERENDILLLAKHFSDEFCKENRMDKLTISNEAQQKLLKHPFPGNVRELKAVIELAVIMSNGTTIEADNILFNSVRPMADFLVGEDTLVGYERKIIRSYLDKYDGNIILVAQKLDIGKSTIYRMLKNKEI